MYLEFMHKIETIGSKIHFCCNGNQTQVLMVDKCYINDPYLQATKGPCFWVSSVFTLFILQSPFSVVAVGKTVIFRTERSLQ